MFPGFGVIVLSALPLAAAEIGAARGLVTIDKPETIAVFDIAAIDTLARLGIAPVYDLYEFPRGFSGRRKRSRSVQFRSGAFPGFSGV